MNKLQIFNNPQFGKIRTTEINGKIYFCGFDVAKSLGYAKPNNAMNQHCKVALKQGILTNGGTQEMSFISEGDVYRLIVRNKLPDAEKFETWLFDEVLPTIRKTGGYVSNDDMFIDTYLPFADETTKSLFRATLSTITQQNKLIEEQKKEISQKEDIIIGLVSDIDLATKRQRITQIIRHGANNNYSERYSLLYTEFEKKYHLDLTRRIESFVIKPKIKNKMDYIDRGINMIPELYEICCKLFENDVNELKKEWDIVIGT